jgi:hypothetical protein
VTWKVAPLVAISLVPPVKPNLFAASQLPAESENVLPTPRSNSTTRPAPLSVSHVPVVSPGTVIVLVSQVFAAAMVNDAM